MTVSIKLLTEEYVPAVKEFNTRLTTGGVNFDFRFPEYSVSEWLPKIPQRRLYQEHFILLENGVVRGAYRLKRQDFSIRGKIVPVDCFHWPMSEGVINKAYSWVFLHMLRHVQQSQPLLYALGMAGNAESLVPRLLQTAGWKVKTLPFFFKVNRPRRFLREIGVLRKTALRGALLDWLAWTGIGTLTIRTIQHVRAENSRSEEVVERVPEFSTWADDLWNECEDRYAMIAVRDSESLNILYPASDDRFLIYKVSRRDKLLGWAVMLDTQMRSNKYFGNMRVGSIVDCLARPQDACGLVGAATRILEKRGVDLIVSNQSQAHWCAAFQKTGYFSGPSNFTFGVSRGLGELLSPFEGVVAEVHMTRGDGDGPIHL